jgi:hypothetical protein
MPLPRLVRRRSVPCPMATGALLLVALLFALSAAAVRALPVFLATEQPEGRGILVVEGWLPRDALRLAAATYLRGGYDAMVVSGGPIPEPHWGGGFETFAERAAAEMRSMGITEPSLLVAPSCASAQDRTYRSAVSVREAIGESGLPVHTLDVFTLGPHARRSRLLYRKAFGAGVTVGVWSVPADFDYDRWWRSSAGVKETIGEAIGYAWALCCAPRSEPAACGSAAPRRDEADHALPVR